MFRLWGQKWLRVLISSPALPVAATSPEVNESPGDDLATIDDVREEMVMYVWRMLPL